MKTSENLKVTEIIYLAPPAYISYTHLYSYGNGNRGYCREWCPNKPSLPNLYVGEGFLQKVIHDFILIASILEFSKFMKE